MCGIRRVTVTLPLIVCLFSHAIANIYPFQMPVCKIAEILILSSVTNQYVSTTVTLSVKERIKLPGL